MMLRKAASFFGLCVAIAAFGLVASVAAQAPASGDWVVQGHAATSRYSV